MESSRELIISLQSID